MVIFSNIFKLYWSNEIILETICDLLLRKAHP
jgi:hypothetical protein